MTDITLGWRPKDITTKPLLKAGFSQDQLDEVGKIFVHRYNGQNIDAGAMYSKMVRSSGSGHNVKSKADNGALKSVLAKQANKSKDGAKKAKEAKNSEADVRAMAAMVNRRWPNTSAEQAIKLFT